jgi:hypothetical protein
LSYAFEASVEFIQRRMAQIPTIRTTVRRIMASREFERGAADVRAGRKPDFETDSWDYERGRQWATMAPPDMPIKVGKRVNPSAMLIFCESKIP